MTVTTDLTPFIKGDTKSIPVKFVKNEAPHDLSGWHLFFTVKYSPEQEDEDAVIRKEIVISGTDAVILLLREDTLELPTISFYYNIELVSPLKDSYYTMLTGRMPLEAA